MENNQVRGQFDQNNGEDTPFANGSFGLLPYEGR